MSVKSQSDIEKLSRDIELSTKQFRERGDALVHGLYRDIASAEDEANALDRDMAVIEKDGIDAIDQAILSFFAECSRNNLPQDNGVV